MKRRTVLSLAAAGLVSPLSLVQAGGTEMIQYSRSTYDQLIASGKPLLLDFSSHS